MESSDERKIRYTSYGIIFKNVYIVKLCIICVFLSDVEPMWNVMCVWNNFHLPARVGSGNRDMGYLLWMVGCHAWFVWIAEIS